MTVLDGRCAVRRRPQDNQTGVRVEQDDALNGALGMIQNARFEFGGQLRTALHLAVSVLCFKKWQWSGRGDAIRLRLADVNPPINLYDPEMFAELNVLTA
jgi:hypothetical protein